MEIPNLIVAVIFYVFVVVLIVLGCFEMIDWLLLDTPIRVTEPLVPELELTVKDNVIDTVYVYRLP
jgi:hypothetical protein